MQDGVMTASRKSIIILFFALIAGFIAGSVILLLLYQALLNFFSGEAFSIISTFTGLTWLFCYPLFAISYLFYRQVGNPFNRWGIILSLVVILGLILAMFYEFQAQNILQQYGSLTYVLPLIPICCAISYYVIGFATINQKQKNTRYLGYFTLVGTICLSLYFCLHIASTSLGIFKPEDFVILPDIANLFLIWMIVVSAPLALLSSVFHGLKDDEQSA